MSLHTKASSIIRITRMWFVGNIEEIDAIERDNRALVSTFVHHCYDEQMIMDVLGARRGFDRHVKSAWHLLVPCKLAHEKRVGYSVDSTPGSDQYCEDLAYKIAEGLDLPVASLPCLIFRAGNGSYYFLKLGGKSREDVSLILREIGDLANECHANGPANPEAYRQYVNTVVVNYLRKKKLLSALKSALPVLERLIGTAVNIKELV